jgi:hypothetical protein
MPDDGMVLQTVVGPEQGAAASCREATSEDRISLDGVWDFLHLIEDYRSAPVGWRSIRVPGPWQAQFADLRMRGGTGIYRRELEIPAGWKRNRIFLKFGAVFHVTRAWVNGELVGLHIGGFLPFSFDVTEQLVEGVNEIKVRADSPMDDPNEFPEAPFAEIPFGKQSWYGPLSGIWQSVWLERRAADHIARARISPELATGGVGVRAFFAQPLVAETRAELTVEGPDGETVSAEPSMLERGSERAELALTMPHVRAWSPAAPDLYTLRLVLQRGGDLVNEFKDCFGFRTIETRGGHFHLNGEPFYLRAALDQGYYPDTICTTPTTEFLEDEFRKAKQLGLNCLRCHIKAPDPRYYEIADRMGLLIWTELPNMGVSTERSRARKRETLKGIVDRDGNHPSIICWTIINENWGVDLVHDPDHRAWLKETYQWLKSYDPGRLVIDNSPLAPSSHIQTDIADYHFYAAFPDSRRSWDSFVQQLADRARWLFAPGSEAVQTGDEPLMCSEFGNWGLPDPECLKDAPGNEPWWFETGHDWGEGVMYAHGVQNRFADWSLGRVFGDLRGFIEAAQWQQFRALKYEIESLRRMQSIAGYVVTELTDAHWECNGLLDMRRNRRVFHNVFRTINADIVIVPRWTRLSYWTGQIATFELFIAHGGGPALHGAHLEVTFGKTRRIELADQAAHTVQALGPIRLLVPDEGQPCMRRIEFALKGGDGSVIATNCLNIAVHPRDSRSPNIGEIWSPDPDLRARLEGLGYRVVTEPEAATIWVTTRLDAKSAAHVRRGGRLLMFPGGEFGLSPLFPHWQSVKVRRRTGTIWRGDWASSFAWLHRPGAFSRMPGGPLLDETFDRVLPNYIISGCNLLDFQARVHAGLVVGWIHKPVALAVERSYGKGRFVVSTFRLFRDAPGADPTATVLLDSLLALAMAQGSAASRDRETVINDLVERARRPTAPRSL